MAKLVCSDHHRRVHVFDSTDGAIALHRKDGLRCDSRFVEIVGGQMTPDEIVRQGDRGLTAMVESIKAYDRMVALHRYLGMGE